MGKTFREFRFFSETLNGRLPLKQGSVRLETSGKCVSDDSQHSTFRRQKSFGRHFFGLGPSFFMVFTRFLRSYAKTDLSKRLPVIFCFRCIYYHLCTTKNHRKYVHARLSTSLFFVSIMCTYVHTCFDFPIYLCQTR